VEDQGVKEIIPPESLLADRTPQTVAIAMMLRDLVRQTVPEALERVRPGWRVIGYDLPVGRRTAFFAWIWPQEEHVHLGFPYGSLLDDPEGVLEGLGVTKRARWFTLTRPDERPLDDLRRFTGAAAELARLRSGGSR
jgi:hypothetical protein